MDNAAFIALDRFGMGRRPDEAPPATPKAWLRAQLNAPDPAPVQGLPTTSAALATVLQFIEIRQQRKAAEGRAQAAEPMQTGMAKGGAARAAMAGNAKAEAGMGGQMGNPVSLLARQEMHDFLGNALVTQAPFRERLVWFWANHFTIAAKSTISSACCGAYVREAIRPHVTGRFSDMLLAVMRHPAMIAYLNQERSAGPLSQAGERRKVGLNENLARESLELHTVSPASGYTQRDVTNYARILTGWSINVKDEPRGFVFRPNLHEPGAIEVMGRTWPEGEAGGVAILQWLGTHPASYHHIATKLACHFVADDPPAADIRRIEAVLTATQGDLGAAANVLIDLPGAWVPGTKLRTPQDFTVACLRGIGATPDRTPNLPGLVMSLGQGIFKAPFPIGWPDRAADWSGPEAMLSRVDFAYTLAARVPDTDPVQFGETMLGPLLTADTMAQVRAAGSRRDGLTLVMASPEFQRR